MKMITKTIATAALTMTIFAFPVFADCGDMTNGSRCLIQGSGEPVVTKSEKNESIDIATFIRDFFGKIFG